MFPVPVAVGNTRSPRLVPVRLSPRASSQLGTCIMNQAVVRERWSGEWLPWITHAATCATTTGEYFTFLWSSAVFGRRRWPSGRSDPRSAAGGRPGGDARQR
jgi:hypothetical protein